MTEQARQVGPFSPDAPRAGDSQRITYFLLMGRIHHYPAYANANEEKERINDASPLKARIVRALNCSKDEILTYEAALPMRLAIEKAVEWFTGQEAGMLGPHAMSVYRELAEVLRKTKRNVSEVRHGRVDGDPE